MTTTLFVSKWYMNQLAAIPPAGIGLLPFAGIEVRETGFLPVPCTYEACDINTKEIVKVPNGEMIHAVIAPKIEFNKIEPPAIPVWDDHLRPHK